MRTKDQTVRRKLSGFERRQIDQMEEYEKKAFELGLASYELYKQTYPRDSVPYALYRTPLS